MKNILWLFITMLLVSCEARLDDNKRVYFTSRILDAQGVPVDGASVSVTTFRTFDFIGSRVSQNLKFSEPDTDFLLGKGTTDLNGDVEFTMLFDTNFEYFVNITHPTAGNKIVSVRQDSFNEDLSLIIPQIIYLEVSDIRLDFVNTSGTTERFRIRANYFATHCDELYENGVFTEGEDCNFNDELISEFNVQAGDGVFEFQAFYPSSVSIIYTDSNGLETQESFIISNPTERYEILY